VDGKVLPQAQDSGTVQMTTTSTFAAAEMRGALASVTILCSRKVEEPKRTAESRLFSFASRTYPACAPRRHLTLKLPKHTPPNWPHPISWPFRPWQVYLVSKIFHPKTLPPCSFGLISRISSHPAVFFSHNKPANSAFSTINQRNEQAVHRILRHRALNVDETRKTNCTVHRKIAR
jgi:hypothetical protein